MHPLARNCSGKQASASEVSGGAPRKTSRTLEVPEVWMLSTEATTCFLPAPRRVAKNAPAKPLKRVIPGRT